MPDTRRLSLQRLSERMAGLMGFITGWTLLSPGLALAHGDDHVTATSFIGPMLALVVVVTVVGLGKAFLRAVVKRS